MKAGPTVRWFRILQERDRRRIRKNVLMGVYLPLCAGILVVALVTILSPAEPPPPDDDLVIGGSSGGGGGDLTEYDGEFGSTAGDVENSPASSEKSLEINLLNIRIISPHTELAKPVIKPKPQEPKKKKQLAAVSGPPPVRRMRGMGQGEGGGTGGGSGGGIGAGVGFSIDWGGEGGRRLLSGRIPKYPTGLTNAEMKISVSFTVLPDGTVRSVMPSNRGDEALEREAVSAIRTWRFEALPEALADKIQKGGVVFDFKLDKSTPSR